MRIHLGFLVAVGTMLASCTPEDERRAYCNAFSNVQTSGDSCTNCTLVDGELADDRNLATFARAVPQSGATSDEVSFTKAMTATVPSGVTVGFFAQPPAELTSMVVAITTHLNGTVQETSGQGNTVVEHGDTPAGRFIGLRTTKAFDSVSFRVTNTWPSGQSPLFRMYELCSDGGFE